MEAIIFSCPECNHQLKVTKTIPAGKKMRCPRCSAIFPMPATEKSAPTGIKKESYDPARQPAAAEPRSPRRREENFRRDEEDQRRPAPRKSGKLMPLLLGVGGLCAVALIFVVTAFLWPGFLNKPAGGPFQHGEESHAPG